jgi:hypothetical protein
MHPADAEHKLALGSREPRPPDLPPLICESLNSDVLKFLTALLLGVNRELMLVCLDYSRSHKTERLTPPDAADFTRSKRLSIGSAPQRYESRQSQSDCGDRYQYSSVLQH